jgi:hypothetical protein
VAQHLEHLKPLSALQLQLLSAGWLYTRVLHGPGKQCSAIAELLVDVCAGAQVEEFVRIASSLLINMGTLSSDWVASKKLAAKEVSSGSCPTALLVLLVVFTPLTMSFDPTGAAFEVAAKHDMKGTSQVADTTFLASAHAMLELSDGLTNHKLCS